MGGRGLGADSPTGRRGGRTRSPNKKKSRGGNGTNAMLAVLLLAAFAFSAATMFFISPKIAKSMVALENMGMGGEDLVAADEPPPEPTPKPKPPEGPRSSVSDLVTWMLSDTDKDVRTQHAALNTLKDSPATPLEFPPGTLSLSHAQTLGHCYFWPEIYGRHVQGNRKDGSRVPTSYSEKHKLAYVMLPKSGSSTARYMLKNVFHAKETSLNLQHKSFEKGGNMEGVEVISFVRDPLSRFFSQYDEAYVQAAPWKSNMKHPFPFLYENLHSYHDYEDVFCPPSTRKTRGDCTFRKSAENGTLASRFERFVKEYNGRNPFDVHLTLQVPMMSTESGLPLHMTQIYNTTDSEGGWKQIARKFLGENATLGEKGVIAGRSYPRRFNSDLVSVETQRRICELTLLDYCCLNLPLPDVCKGKHFEVDGVKRELFCVLDTKGQIQPGIFPQRSES